MNCKCIEQVNGRLKDLNLQLSCTAWRMPGFVTTFALPTAWIDKDKAPKAEKKRPTPIYATYCPFCGQAIDNPGETPPKDAKEEKGQSPDGSK